jgi:hypothetical protein
MPTTNPRINVTLSPSLDLLVSRLATLERVSKSMVLRELLEAAEPSLVHAVALMEAAQGASAKARQAMVQDMQSGIKAAEGVSELMLRNLTQTTRDMVSEAQAVRGRRPARARRAAPDVSAPVRRGAARGSHGVEGAKRPPSSNRGVKS